MRFPDGKTSPMTFVDLTSVVGSTAIGCQSFSQIEAVYSESIYVYENIELRCLNHPITLRSGRAFSSSTGNCDLRNCTNSAPTITL